MKKTFFWIFASCTLQIVYPQSQINKTVLNSTGPLGNYQLFNITALKSSKNDGRFNRALAQVDVIGNDYSNDKRVWGVNKNDDDSNTPTDYKPVDGFKRTFCGAFHNSYYGGSWYTDLPGVGRLNLDRDQCIEIKVDENNEFLKNYKYVFDRLGSASFFEPWNIIEGEVHDMHTGNEYSIGNLQSDVCMYGPWVLELFDPIEGALSQPIPRTHKNNNEIHPMEQMWYKEKPVEDGNTGYRLNLFVDASKRFGTKSKYESIPAEHDLFFQPWSKAPLDGKFYVAFEINLKRKERITYWIEIVKNEGVHVIKDDTKNHLLVYGRDTLMNIFEGSPESVNIDFDNVGYKPLRGNRFDSSILVGFLVISSRITGFEVPLFGLIPFGSLELRVEKKIKSMAGQTIQFTVEKIKRLQTNSFRHFNPVTNTTYTDPANAFNETQVFLTLLSGNDVKNELPLELSKGQEKTLNGFQCTRKGLASDEYRFEIDCNNGYSGPKLGKLIITGKNLIPNATIKNTLLLYSIQTDGNSDSGRNERDHSERSIRVAVFAITYKITAISTFVSPGNK